MKPILEIKNISKKFRIGHARAPYVSLRESLGSLFRSEPGEDFYALQDVSFDVAPGETLGIIGRNGAGKSTLLKILSRITPPTSGKITCRGRIASLLEVGTGFHPELTGRENIFLNGSILGMKRREIISKFEEIVAFSGVEKFLDTPLKHYSSGMQLRLAFAVAAFLEPEILVIDEVLAVGDAEFQKKCLGKMKEVAGSGRTLLFVSHNMEALGSLCREAVLLEQGKLAGKGKSAEVIQHYLAGIQALTAGDGVYAVNGKVIRKIELNCDGQPTSEMRMGCSMEVRVEFSSESPVRFPVLGIVIRDGFNNSIIGVNNKFYQDNLVAAPVYRGRISLRIPYLQLLHGNYSADIFFGDGPADMEVVRDTVRFSVEAKPFNGSALLPESTLNKFFIKDLRWTFENKAG